MFSSKQYNRKRYFDDGCVFGLKKKTIDSKLFFAHILSVEQYAISRLFYLADEGNLTM